MVISSFVWASSVQLLLLMLLYSSILSSMVRLNFLPAAMISREAKSSTRLEVCPSVSLSNLSINTLRSCSFFLLYSPSIRSVISLISLRFLSKFLEKSLVSITTPRNEGEALREASFTSLALSPKIARRRRSSGVGSDSPLGVILPTRMSPGTICAPMRTIPFSAKSFVASSLTLGISLVSSSRPRLVSRTSSCCSSTCTEVKKSSRTIRSLSTIASS